jgi:hypothetical protein
MPDGSTALAAHRNTKMESRLIARRRELELKLRQENTDPRRKRLLTQQMLALDRDIAAIGLDEVEIKHNPFNYNSNVETVESKQFYIPLPSWMTSGDDGA